MQVVAGGTTGRAHVANQLTGLHILALLDHVTGHVHIYAGVAVLMIDGNVVALGIAPGCLGHHAAPAGINGSILRRRQVNTPVHGPLAGDRMPTIAEGAGHADIIHRHNPVHTGGIFRGLAGLLLAGLLDRFLDGLFNGFLNGLCDGLLHRFLDGLGNGFPDRFLNGLHHRLPDGLLNRVGDGLLLGQLVIVFLLSTGDFIHHTVLFFFKFLVKPFLLVGKLAKLLYQPVLLGAFLLQLDHFQLQLGTHLLQTGLIRRQLIPGRLHLLGDFDHFIQPALIRCGDFPDHVHTVQKIRKGMGPEEHRPIGQLPLLLHDANPVQILLSQGFQPFLGCIQFLLLICNQQIVSGNLVIDVINIFIIQLDFLIDGVLLMQEQAQLRIGSCLLFLQLLHLRQQIFPVGFQAIQMLFELAGGLSAGFPGQQPHKQGQNQRRNQQAGNQRNP